MSWKDQMMNAMSEFVGRGQNKLGKLLMQVRDELNGI